MRSAAKDLGAMNRGRRDPSTGYACVRMTLPSEPGLQSFSCASGADLRGERVDLGLEVREVPAEEFQDEVLDADLAQLLDLVDQLVRRAGQHMRGTRVRGLRERMRVELDPGIGPVGQRWLLGAVV